MNIIKHLQNHYFLKLLLHLGGFAFLYKQLSVSFSKIRNISQQQQRLRSDQTRNISQLRKQLEDSQQIQLSKLQYQLVSGLTIQDDEIFVVAKGESSPHCIAIKESKFLKRRQSQYFSLVDRSSDTVHISLSDTSVVSKDLYQKFQVSKDPQKKHNKLISFFVGLFTFKANYHGLTFGSNIYVFGDLIFNHELKILRMYNARYLGTFNNLKWFLRWIKLYHYLGCFLYLTAGVGLLKSFIILHKKTTQKKLPLKVAEISKGNESFRCEKCKKNLIDLVFLPCGHFNFCHDCGINIEICPQCNKEVNDAIKIFKS